MRYKHMAAHKVVAVLVFCVRPQRGTELGLFRPVSDDKRDRQFDERADGLLCPAGRK